MIFQASTRTDEDALQRTHILRAGLLASDQQTTFAGACGSGVQSALVAATQSRKSGVDRGCDSAYASWAGAYTLLDPTLITISSHDPVTQAAVESLFHEASHAMIQKVSDALTAELDAQRKLFRRRAFWHAVLFYTAGEIAQRHLDDYTMFGVQKGIFERGWPGALPVLEKDWKPYLDGKIDLATAVHRLVEDYGVPK